MNYIRQGGRGLLILLPFYVRCCLREIVFHRGHFVNDIPVILHNSDRFLEEGLCPFHSCDLDLVSQRASCPSQQGQHFLELVSFHQQPGLFYQVRFLENIHSQLYALFLLSQYLFKKALGVLMIFDLQFQLVHVVLE